MKFTKNKKMFVLVVFIALAMYNVIAFTLPFERDNGFWVGYVSSTLAIIIAGGAALFALGREGMKSKFYGLPIAMMAWSFFTVVLAVNFILMIIPTVVPNIASIPFQYGILANAIILGLFLIGVIGTNAATEEVERIDKVVKEKTFFAKSLQVDIEGLATKASDESLKKSLKTLAETIRYCDPMSTPQLAEIENEIKNKAAKLADSIGDINAANILCEELQQLFAERNKKCKLLK